MTNNLCNCKRAALVVVGLFIASLAFWGFGNPWFLLGLLPALAGALGCCPLATIFGKNKDNACSTSSCCCKSKK